MEMNLIERAMTFAVKAHHGQARKSSTNPYVLHPMEVATIVATMTEDEEVIAASLLHDTVEDTRITIEDIEDAFGPRIRYLVESETEKKKDDLDGSEIPWKTRKEESLKELRNTTDRSIKMLWVADKLSNMRSFFRMYLNQGNELWNAFNQNDPKEQKWYYTEILNCIEDLNNTAAYNEYKFLLSVIFKEVE